MQRALVMTAFDPRHALTMTRDAAIEWRERRREFVAERFAGDPRLEVN